MKKNQDGQGPSDALVLFGITGDLAYKKIFPALYAMAQRGKLNLPIVGVASSALTPAQLRRRIKDSIGQSGLAYDQAALEQLISLVRYVDGDYKKPDTFLRLKQALGKARRPTHYLAIPPSLFGTVIKSLRSEEHTSELQSLM